MWILFARAAPPDASYWPGRRWLAALDAVGWPTFWLMVMSHVPARTGLAGAVLVTMAVILGAYRLHVALCQNHRYRFAVWRWGRPMLVVVLFGWVLKHALVL